MLWDGIIMDNNIIKELITVAMEYQKRAYTKYSGFNVGAALLCDSDRIYGGCNVENATYGATICAERTAAVKAVSEGERVFKAIAIVGGDLSDYCSPCGICRQFLYEFAEAGMQIILAKSIDDYKLYTIEELLPEGFRL